VRQNDLRFGQFVHGNGTVGNRRRHGEFFSSRGRRFSLRG
jgi:hypothetical protein